MLVRGILGVLPTAPVALTEKIESVNVFLTAPKIGTVFTGLKKLGILGKYFFTV